MPQSVDETESTVVFNELTNEIQQAIQQLPKKSQQVFRLNRLEGRSVSEIADFLKLSERAIEYHLTKSLKQLRAHLKDFILALFLFLNF
jgi:RNA polymerase sigma-70 factor (ECF subfamily)